MNEANVDEVPLTDQEREPEEQRNERIRERRTSTTDEVPLADQEREPEVDATQAAIQQIGERIRERRTKRSAWSNELE